MNDTQYRCLKQLQQSIPNKKLTNLKRLFSVLLFLGDRQHVRVEREKN